MDFQTNNLDNSSEKELQSHQDKNDNSSYQNTSKEVEAPLSPVLNNSKHSMKHIVRQKSRIKLLHKLSQSSLESQAYLSQQDNAENNVHTDSKQNKISEDDELEERIKRYMEIQRNKKFYYNLAVSPLNSSEINKKNLNFTDNSLLLVDEIDSCYESANTILLSKNKLNTNNDKKNSLSENVSLFDDIKEISHELPKLDLLAKEKFNIGFETGSGKKINLSEKSLRRAVKLFDDIIDLPSESSNNLNENNTFCQKENKKNTNNLELNTTEKKETVFVCPKPVAEKKISYKTTSQKSPYKNVHFGEISDSQMFLVAESIECLTEFTNSQWTSPKTTENQNTLKDVEDELTTQQKESLFSEFTVCEDGSFTSRENEDISSDNETIYGFDSEEISKSLKIAEIYNSQNISKIDENSEEFCTQQIDLFFINLTFCENGSLVPRKTEIEEECYGFPPEEILKSIKVAELYKRKLLSSVFNDTQSNEENKNNSRYSFRSRNKTNTHNRKTRKPVNKSQSTSSSSSEGSQRISSNKSISTKFNSSPVSKIEESKSFIKTEGISDKILEKSQTSVTRTKRKLTDKKLDIISESKGYSPPIKTFKDEKFSQNTIYSLEQIKLDISNEMMQTSVNTFNDFNELQNKNIKSNKQNLEKIHEYDQEDISVENSHKNNLKSEDNFASTIMSTNFESPQTVPAFGFSTASGKKVKVSKESLDKMKDIFKDCDFEEDARKTIESPKVLSSVKTPKNVSTRGFSTPTEKKVKISKDTSNKVTELFDDYDLKENIPINIESPKISTYLKTPSFSSSTTSGKQVEISKESLNKVQKHFDDCDFKENISPKVLTHFKTPKNISAFGFSTASGKKVDISKESLDKVKNLFDDCDLEEDTSTNIESLKVSTNFETPKNVSSFGFSTASGKKVDISKESLNKVKNLFDDCGLEENTSTNIESLKVSTNFETPKNVSSFGFSTASGKKVDISKESLDKVKNLFDDCGLEENTSTNIELLKDSTKFETPKNVSTFGFSTASGQKVELSKESLSKVKNLFDDCGLEENTSTNIELLKDSTKFETPKNVSTFGFSTASGKKVDISKEYLSKVKNLFDDCGLEENTSTNIELLKDSTKFETPKNVSTFGFSTASGQKVAVSKESLNKVQNLFNNCDLPKNESNITESSKSAIDNIQTPKNVSFGFSTASGNKVKVSTESMDKVKNIFNDCDLQEDAAKKIEESLKNNSENMETFSPQNKSISSDFLSSNESTPVLRNRNISCRKSKKRNLGISPCRQINISQNSLKKAKLIFEDFDSPTTKSITINNNLPNYSISVSQSPKQTIPSSQNKCLLKTSKVPVTNFSLVKMSCTDFSQKSSPFSFHNETQGDVKSWKMNLQKEYEMCKLKMSVIETRMQMLDKQEETINRAASNHRRQRSGILFTKKSQIENRISFQKAVNNIRPGKITNQICLSMGLSPSLLEITAENAPKLHFHVPWWKNDNRIYPAVIRTEDEAIVIPNQENYVGVSEIESAFLAMPGIDPNLVPKKWVLNHFRWIVWKLASMERNYPNVFRNCLTIENVVDQLKYRYDREIDRAQRPALRKILECDDTAAKRMVLCVATIYKMENKYEIELIDGWYSVRTILDPPLISLVERNVIKIGMKLVTQGAELLNCEGCCPLEIPPNVRLQIHYNSTRRALWHTRLGFQPDPGPLCIQLRSIHSSGGPVGLSVGYIARVYPIVYLERQEKQLVWRNNRAEQRCANRWEAERAQRLEALQMQLQSELEAEWDKERCGKRKEKVKDLKDVCCGETLFYMLENSNDPDSLKEMMSPTQCIALENYQNQLNITRQSELSNRLRQKLQKENIQSRNVSCVLKLLLVDVQSSFHSKILNIWKPTEAHLQDLKEGLVVKIYHIVTKNNNTLSSVSRTKFDINFDINTDKFDNINRNVVSISQTLNLGFKPQFGEFDTVGMIVALDMQQTAQFLWLSDEHHRYLLIKIRDDPDNCCLLDGLTPGKIVAAINLMYCKSHKNYSEATANVYSVLSSYPQYEYLQDFMKNYIQHLPENIDEYLEKCKNEISNITEINKCNTVNLVKLKTETGNENFEDMLCGTTTNLSKSDSLTLSDEEMALISSQLF